MNAEFISRLSPSASPVRLARLGQASCGFPSPAADYQEPDLSLDELVGIGPTSSIFMMRALGDSMLDAGIHTGDVLIVDKARSPREGDVVVAVLGAEFLVKRLAFDSKGRPLLLADNPSYAPVLLGEDEQLEIWGTCVWVLHSLATRQAP